MNLPNIFNRETLHGKWKLLINEEADRRELYNLAEDWAEQDKVIDQYPDKAEAMERELNEWQKTLPQEANPSCFSKEREVLLEKE